MGQIEYLYQRVIHILVASSESSGHFAEYTVFKERVFFKERLDCISGDYWINELIMIEKGNRDNIKKIPQTQISLQYLPFSAQPTQFKIADCSTCK